MIGENLYDFFYGCKGKRGIDVVGKKLSTVYLVVLVAMIILPICIFIFDNSIYLTSVFLLVFILFIYLNRKVDKELEEAKRKEIPKDKKAIKKFLNKYGVSHSDIYKEIAKQLERKSREYKKTFNLYPQINIILPFIILLLSLVAYDNREYLLELFIVSIFITFSFLIINPFLNLYSELFFNTKAERMFRLSYLVNEVYLDELIRENYTEYKMKV